MTQKARYSQLEQYGYGPNAMKKTKVCIKCGQITRANTKICPACGEKLPKETLFDRYKKQHVCCPDCDTVLTHDSQYCPNCGMKILLKAEENTV